MLLVYVWTRRLVPAQRACARTDPRFSLCVCVCVVFLGEGRIAFLFKSTPLLRTVRLVPHLQATECFGGSLRARLYQKKIF